MQGVAIVMYGDVGAAIIMYGEASAPIGGFTSVYCVQVLLRYYKQCLQCFTVHVDLCMWTYIPHMYMYCSICIVFVAPPPPPKYTQLWLLTGNVSIDIISTTIVTLWEL